MTSRNPWPMIGFDALALGLEAASVITLRTMKLAMGGAGADAEAQLMLDEKVKAALDLQTKLITGKLGTTPATATRRALRHYSRKVRANRKRLSGG